MAVNSPEPRSEKNMRRTVMLAIVGAVLVVVAIFAFGSGRDMNIQQPSAVVPQSAPATPDSSTPESSASGSTAPAGAGAGTGTDTGMPPAPPSAPDSGAAP